MFAAALGRRAAVGAVLTGLLASALLAGVRFAPAEPPPKGAITTAAVSPGTDLYGDPLPPGAIARLGTVRYRVDEWVTVQRIAFAADNKTVVALAGKNDNNNSFAWWDATSGKLLRRVRPGNGMDWCNECAITPDGKIAVTVPGSSGERYEGGESPSSRFRLKWWETATGKELASAAIPDFEPAVSHCVAITADGDTVATGEIYGHYAVRIWDRTTRKQTAVYWAKDGIEDVTLSRNGKTAAFVTGKEGVFSVEICVPAKAPGGPRASQELSA